MKTFPGVLYISSISKFFVLFALILLFTNATIVNSQNSTNSANGNVLNPNANAAGNGNASGSTTGNTTPSPNGNTNSNTNSNSNTNDNSNNNVDGRKKELADSIWFPAVMTLFFLWFFCVFTFIIARSIYYSGSTYRSPLGLPDGTFRAILAYTLVMFLGSYVLAGALSLSDFKPPEYLIGIIATVIGFYFGSRTAEDRGAGTRTVGIIQGSVKDITGTPAVGATVDLSQSGTKKFTQNTDLLGNFRFDNVPIGDYDIKASLADQASDIMKLKVTTSQSQPIELKLK